MPPAMPQPVERELNAPKDEAVFNVSPSLAAAYASNPLVIRSHDVLDLVRTVTGCEGLDRLAYVQVLLPGENARSVKSLPDGVPVDLVMPEPGGYGQLYEWADLCRNRPVRVTVPIVPGFRRAVKVALALDFPVKLDGRQLGRDVAEDVFLVLEHYLHHPAVSQPVEYFHSLLAWFCGGGPVTIWSIQEEDPETYRYLTAEGEETLSPSLGADLSPKDPRQAVAQYRERVRSRNDECQACEFLDPCCGYFKWPGGSGSCVNGQELLRTLRRAAAELKRDVRR